MYMLILHLQPPATIPHPTQVHDVVRGEADTQQDIVMKIRQ